MNNKNREDKKNNSDLSKIDDKSKNFIFNNKILLCIVFFIIAIVICLFLYLNNKNDETFELNLLGEDTVTIYQGTDYVEPGYMAYNDQNEDLTNHVVIMSNVDVKFVGEYQIIYKLGKITKSRKVVVTKKPADYITISLNTVDNDVNVYLKLGEKYIEPGFEASSSNGKNYNHQVEITGKVNTNKPGKYRLVYSLVNSDGIIVSATRTVTVINTDIKLSLNTYEYTNQDIVINVEITDEYFDYLILPDGSKINEKNYSYQVSENGKYIFKMYNKKGINKEESIKVNNIDRQNPTGSCTGRYRNGISTINVNASDNVGIKKYVIDGIEYTEKQVRINKEIKNANITIYDKAGNTQNISCNLNYAKVKNVIYLIGDGMGFNHLEKTKLERNYKLVIDTFDIKGEAKTRSLSDLVTDSAAGGTALATGSRTGNGIISAYYDDKNMTKSYPKNITELCMENGMLTGVITTDATSGATPATFSAHSSSRNNTEDISYDQLSSGINLIWGEANGVITKNLAQKNGYEYITNYNEMAALKPGSYSFGQFSDSLWKMVPEQNTPNLEQMAIKAVDLLDDTEDGFFLMIEGAHIDKHSHNNDDYKMTQAMIEFDRTIELMLKYAELDGETLVVITADHETGGLTLMDNLYVYTRDSHSDANVPIRVYGYNELITENEVLDNYEIPIRIARALGFGKEQFPISVKVK